ncbi:hypothetical protein BESB_019260 [Besnoitia besnoiti]|uniref:MYND-type domain-containing protein n=1 Tax=Besnoitia besnoiti TaxID=94643 RepID=A0A2A9M1X5_BESBE|nr:hypothetical protein BESB_019260 [Besnoitia besnoiti]PFH31985.1 hypothetical protein BESB_019260 [Besnoitia besnoiti]
MEGGASPAAAQAAPASPSASAPPPSASLAQAIDELVSMNLEEISQFWKHLEKEGLDTQRRCKKVDSHDLLLQFLHQVASPTPAFPLLDEEDAKSAPASPPSANEKKKGASFASKTAASKAEKGLESKSDGKEGASRSAPETRWYPGWIPLLQEAMGAEPARASSPSADASPPAAAADPRSGPCRIKEASAMLAAQHHQMAFSVLFARDASWFASAIDAIAETSSLLPEGLLAKAHEEETRERAAAALKPNAGGAGLPRSKAGRRAHASGDASRREDEGDGNRGNAKIEALGKQIERDCVALLDDYFVSHFEAKLKADMPSTPMSGGSLSLSRKSPVASPASGTPSAAGASSSPAASPPSLLVTAAASSLTAGREKRFYRAVAHLYLLGTLSSSEYCVSVSRSWCSQAALHRSLPPLLLLCLKRGGFVAAAVSRALLHLASTGCGARAAAAPQKEATAVGGDAPKAADEAESGDATTEKCKPQAAAGKAGAAADKRPDLIDLYGDTIITFLHLCLREQAVDPRGINALGFFFLAPAVPLLLQTKRLRDRLLAPGEKAERHQQILGWYLEVLLKALSDPQFRVLASGNLQLARYVSEVVLELAASPEGCRLLHKHKLGWFVMWRTTRELWGVEWNKGEHAAWELIMNKSIRGGEPVEKDQVAALCMWGPSSSEGGCAYCLRSENTLRFLRLYHSPYAEDVPLSPDAQEQAQQLKLLQQEMQRSLEEAETGMRSRRGKSRAAAGKLGGAAAEGEGDDAQDDHDQAREMHFAVAAPHMQRARQQLERRRAEKKKKEAAALEGRTAAAELVSGAASRGRRQPEEEQRTAKRQVIADIWATVRESLARGAETEDEGEAEDRDDKEDEAAVRKASLEPSPALVCTLSCIGFHAPWLMRAVQLGGSAKPEGAEPKREEGGKKKKGKKAKTESLRSKTAQKKKRDAKKKTDAEDSSATENPRSAEKSARERGGEDAKPAVTGEESEKPREGGLEKEERKMKTSSDTEEADEGAAASNVSTHAPASSSISRAPEAAPSLSKDDEQNGGKEAAQATDPSSSPCSLASVNTSPQSPSSPCRPAPALSSAPSSDPQAASAEEAPAEVPDDSLVASQAAESQRLLLSPCPACGYVEYCSEQCRINDLPLHLFICAAAAEKAAEA